MEVHSSRYLLTCLHVRGSQTFWSKELLSTFGNYGGHERAFVYVGCIYPYMLYIFFDLQLILSYQGVIPAPPFFGYH